CGRRRVVGVIVVVDVRDVDLCGADRLPGVPGGLEDHECDREAGQRVCSLEAEPDEERACDAAEGDEAGDSGVVAGGDERCACEPAAGAETDLRWARSLIPRARRTIAPAQARGATYGLDSPSCLAVASISAGSASATAREAVASRAHDVGCDV